MSIESVRAVGRGGSSESRQAPGVLAQTARYALTIQTRASDTSAFRRWAMDPRMMTPMNLPARSLTAQQVADFWSGFDNQNRFFFGVTEAAGTPVGFWQVECDPLHQSATFQLALDPACHGAGCATETAVPLLDWLFGPRNISKLIVMTLPDNKPMQALLARLGFVQEGLMRQEIKNLAGSGRLDQLRFGLLPSGWQAARPTVIAHLNNRAAGANRK